MYLSEIRDGSEFGSFYTSRKLFSVEDKIAFLRKEMGIILVRGDELLPEEELSTLEQHVLVGWDRVSHLEKPMADVYSEMVKLTEKIIKKQKSPDPEIEAAFSAGLGKYAEAGFSDTEKESKKMSDDKNKETINPEIVSDNSDDYGLQLEKISVLKGSLEEFRIRQETMLRVAGFEKESVVDGPGVRYTIFVQGCLKHCPNCHNPETHDLNGGELMSIYDIYKDIKDYKMVHSVTFSGGEPVLQHKALTNLAQLLREDGYDIISYSGFTFEEIYSKNMLIPFLRQLDYLVDGPFIESLKSLDCKYRGSSNQRIIDVQKSLEKREAVTTEL